MEERLDRVVATDEWSRRQEETKVFNIFTRISDHSALFLDVYGARSTGGRHNNGFQFEMA